LRVSGKSVVSISCRNHDRAHPAYCVPETRETRGQQIAVA
jgi:hypothetical protein